LHRKRTEEQFVQAVGETNRYEDLTHTTFDAILAAALVLPASVRRSSKHWRHCCPVQIRHTNWKAASSGFSPYKIKGVALYLQYMNVTNEEIKEG